jgi:hypothetical protein
LSEFRGHGSLETSDTAGTSGMHRVTFWKHGNADSSEGGKLLVRMDCAMNEVRTGLHEGLVFEALVVFVEAAILEHGDPFAQGLLEFEHPRLKLIEPLSLFHALNVRSKRFGQIDCGKHLHDGTHNGPTILVYLSVSVSDIRHLGSSGGRIRTRCGNTAGNA